MAIGLIASGCSIAPYAAVVNGQTISVSQLNTELQQLTSNSAFVSKVVQSQGSVFGQGPGTYNATFVTEVLNRRVSLTLLSQALARRHIIPAKSDLAIALPEAQASYGGAAIFNQFPKPYQLTAITDTADIQLLEASLEHVSISAASLVSLYNSSRVSLTKYCASQILVPTQAAALSEIAKLRNGASFAAVARADSKDTNTAAGGGAIGCGLATDYQRVLGTAFAQAVVALQPGTVSQPVKTNNGWSVIEVTSATLPTFGQAIPVLVAQVLGTKGNTLLGAAISKLANHSSVKVNPAYGTISRVSGQLAVVPPSPPSNAALNIFKPPTAGA